MKRSPWGVGGLLFLSGACSLIYQTVWMREMRLVFGASTAASAAVTGIFMGGLGLGGWLFGRHVERHPRPLELYGRLELLVCLSAALSPLAIAAVRSLYLSTGGSDTLGMFGATLLRLGLSALVLGVPTVLMGGTLPAAARAVADASDVARARVALLFGLNTLGAVSGVLLSTFVLLEVYGNRHTLWLACLLNVLVALFARSWSRSGADLASTPPPLRTAGADGAPVRVVLAIAAVVGFAFMLMELVWYRMLSPLLGGSTYTFGVILAVALLGIGLGGGLYAWWGARRPATLGGLAVTCTLEALLLIVPLALGDRLALLTVFLRPIGVLGFGSLVSGWGLVAALVILPGAIVSGFQLPLLIALLGRGDAQVGRHIGLAYAWNTVGSIGGSLAGGFGFLPLLSAVGTWRVACALLAVTGLFAALQWGASARRFTSPALLVACSALTLAALASGPSAVWRHSGIGAGRSQLLLASTANDVEAVKRIDRRRMHAEYEGLESSVGLTRGHGLAFIVNGKTDGSLFRDTGTQVMGGLIGAALHPQVKRALVIGLGTGTTAGWLARVPSIERVDVAEIEPAIFEVARAMSPGNQDPLNNPRVHPFHGDAREYLVTSQARYDLIFSEPSNPYRSGISSLYTREYYQAARERLGEQGLFLQWLQIYEVQPQTVRSVMATLAGVFPHVEVWSTMGGDVVLVASASPVPHPVAQLRARLAQEPFLTGMRIAWKAEGVEGFLAHHLAGPQLGKLVAEQWSEDINTDDDNTIEFAFARSVGQSVGLGATEFPLAALRLGASHPTLSDGEVDWARVDEQAAFGVLPLPFALDRLPGPARQRVTALQAPLPDLAQRWLAQPFAPEGPGETLRLAWALADQGKSEAEPLLDRLTGLPVEARVLRALLRLRQGNLDASLTEFSAAVAMLRGDAWCDLAVGGLLFETLAPVLARQGPATARRLSAELAAPFPNLAFDEQRTLTRVRLSVGPDFASTCAEALAPFEPWAKWERPFLQLRVDCYRATNAGLRAAAEEDLAHFLANEPQPLLPGADEAAAAAAAAR